MTEKELIKEGTDMVDESDAEQAEDSVANIIH